MTRAYLRLDPLFDERKEAYPDGAYVALVSTLCLAESQPARGRFRSFDYYRRLLGKRAKWAKFLLEHHDLVTLEDQRVYVVGWDEWQEGDHTVTERMQRIRSRRAGVTVPVTVDVTADDTVPVTADRLAVGGSVSGKHLAVGGDGADNLTPVIRYAKLTDRGIPKPVIQEWINRLADQYGTDEFIFAVNMARELNGSEHDLKNAEVILEERRVKREGEERDLEASRLPKTTPEQVAAARALVSEWTGKVKSA